jgi:hypothetical protein
MKQKDINKRLSIMQNIEMTPSKLKKTFIFGLQSNLAKFFCQLSPHPKIEKESTGTFNLYIGFFMKKICPNSLDLEEENSKLPTFLT